MGGRRTRARQLAVRPLGIGFTLLKFGRKAARTDEIEAAALQRSIPLKVISLYDAGARELYGRDFVLIRPDQYVAWRGNAPPDDADRLLARLTGSA